MNKYFYNNNINNFAVLYILGILITHSASLVPEKYINSKKNFNNIINNFDIIANDVYKVDADVARALGFQTNVFMDLNNFSIGGKQYINLRRLKDVYFVYNEERNVIIIYFFEDYKDVA